MTNYDDLPKETKDVITKEQWEQIAVLAAQASEVYKNHG